jgi:hypothetical protein
LILVLFLVLSCAPFVVAQSGRNPQKTSKPVTTKTKSSPDPVAEPARSPATSTSSKNSQTPLKPSPSPAETTGEEIDPADTVRVSSNLVPIPASVVDPRGFAITGLKLEDFELLVDGQVRAISELNRSETPGNLFH